MIGNIKQSYIELNGNGRIHSFYQVNENDYANSYDVDWSDRDGCYYSHLTGGGPFTLLPEFIPVGPEFDLSAIASDSGVEWCSKCKSQIPTENLCRHIWWSDKLEWWSTPDDRKRPKLGRRAGSTPMGICKAMR